MAGKGSNRRKENFKEVQKGYDLIDWGEKKKNKSKDN
jgi:hypothetical protein